MKILNKKKGVALLWALITSAVLIFIGAITADAVIKESRMTVDIEESSQAYAAASSGMEAARWCIDNLDKCDKVNATTDSSFAGMTDASTSFTVDVKPNTPKAGVYTIKSSGTTGKVNRTLEYEYTSSPFKPLTLRSYKPDSKPRMVNADDNSTVVFENSFSFQFDIWRNDGTVIGYQPEEYVYVGLGSKSNPAVRMVLRITNASTPRSEGVFLEVYGYKDGVLTVPPITSEAFSLDEAGISDLTGHDPVTGAKGYAMRVRLQYIQDSSLEITIIKKDWVTEQNCTIRFSKDMTGIKFAPNGVVFSGFDYIEGYPNQSNNDPTTTVGDGQVIPMKHDASDNHTWGFLDNFGYKE